MALPPPSGSSTPDLNVNNVPNETPKTQRDLLGNMPMAIDTNLNKPAIDASAYPKTALLIAGFLRGMRIRVTYYAQAKQGGGNDQTALTDYASEQDALTREYYRILNMELTLKTGVSFSFNPDDATSDITYQGLVYPGDQPNTGDRMVYEFGPGQVAVLTVNKVEPTSLYQNTAWLIEFGVQSFADYSDIDALNKSVTKTFVWTKSVNGGVPYSVLTQDTYLLLKFVTSYRSELMTYYFENFYSDILNSFVRPDGVYDPTCVRFMVNKISIQDTGRRCAILYRDIDRLYGQSLWGRLASRYRANMNGMGSGYQIVTPQMDGFSAFFNELYDRLVILPKPFSPISLTTTNRQLEDDGVLEMASWVPAIIGPTGWFDYSAAARAYTKTEETKTSYYAFSKAFWTNDVPNMSQTERYLRDIIFTRSLSETDPEVLKAYFLSLPTMDALTQYYTIPVMIHMIDVLKRIIPDVVNARNL